MSCTTERRLTRPEIPAGISVNCNPNSPPWSVRGVSEVRFSTLAAGSESRHWRLPKKDMTPSASTFPAAPSSELGAQQPVAVRTSNLASPTSRNRQGTKLLLYRRRRAGLSLPARAVAQRLHRIERTGAAAWREILCPGFLYRRLPAQCRLRATAIHRARIARDRRQAPNRRRGAAGACVGQRATDSARRFRIPQRDNRVRRPRAAAVVPGQRSPQLIPRPQGSAVATNWLPNPPRVWVLCALPPPPGEQ